MAYDPDFIDGFTLRLPRLGDEQASAAWQQGKPIDHRRFSVLFNQNRGLAFCTAHNIDGSTVIPEGEIRRRNWFEFDPGLPSGLQIDNERGYRNNPWDRGHLVRRRSLHWGDADEAREADRESFYWTNIAPQHEALHSGSWGRIEQWMFGQIEDDAKRACVFQGPVFTDLDPLYQNTPDEVPIRIPAGFWKIMCVQHQGALLAAAFLVWQRDYDQPEPVDFDPVLEQVRITTIEYLTGLGFDDVRSADALRAGIQSGSRRGAVSQPSASAPPGITGSRFIHSANDLVIPSG